MRVISPYKSLYLRDLSPLAAAVETSAAVGSPANNSGRERSPRTRHLASSISDASSSSSSSSRLSSCRGRHAVSLLPSYLADARAVTQYSSETPNGALQLGVAESLMLEDWLVPVLNSQGGDVPADAIYYQPTAGRTDFREIMATYVEDMLGLRRGRIHMDGLVVGAGCNAVLENLCFALSEAGEAVLIPTPYYAAFEFDLVARAGLTVVPVTTEAYQTPSATDPARMYYPNTAALDAAYEKAFKSSGRAPRILLISHPQNPLGICYPAAVVQECIDWCRDREVHLISDEIYAGSIYRPTVAGFKSALQLADGPGGLGPYVHWVYALSKDFALSGLRVGALYTENEEIQVPLQKLNDLCQVRFIKNSLRLNCKLFLLSHCLLLSSATDFIHDTVVDEGIDGTQTR